MDGEVDNYITLICWMMGSCNLANSLVRFWVVIAIAIAVAVIIAIDFLTITNTMRGFPQFGNRRRKQRGGSGGEFG